MVTVAEPLGEAAPWLQLTAAVTASSGDLQVKRSGSTLALPWPTVLLLAAFVGFRVGRRRRRRRAASGAKGAGGTGGPAAPGAGAPRTGGPGAGGVVVTQPQLPRDGSGRRGPADLIRRAGAAIGAAKRPTG